MKGSTNAQSQPPIVIYGFKVKSGVSSTPANITFTRGAAGMSYDQRVELYSKHARPCTVDRAKGDLNYLLNPSNGNQKLAGGTAKLDGTDGDVMVMVDTIWYKSYFDGTDQCHEFAFQDPKAIGETGFDCWCHKYGDLTLPYIFIGMFKASGDTSACYSVSTTEKPARSMTMPQFETAYKATGANSPAQYCGVGTPERNLLCMLLTFVSGYTNSQGFYGMGYVSAQGSEENLSATNLGFAPTSMMKSGDTSTGLSGVMSGYFNNLWGNVYEFNHQTIFDNYKLKFSYRHDDHIADITTATYAGAPDTFYETRIGMNAPSATGWAYATRTMVDETPCSFFPQVLGGSTSTYLYDGIYVNIGALTDRCVLAGGALYNGATAGLFCLYVSNALGDSDWNVGSRLLIRPIQLAR